MVDILKALLNHVQVTPLPRLLRDMIVVMVLSLWLGMIVVGVTKFDQLHDLIKGSRNIPVKEIARSIAGVDSLLDKERLRLNVDRIHVSKFHNGKTDVLGIHFLYVSRISEAVGPGISQEIITTQEIPVSIFSAMAAEITMGQCYYVEEVDDTTQNAEYLSHMGVSSVLMCPLLAPNGTLIGVVGIDGVVSKIDPAERPTLEKELQTISSIIGAMLGSPK